MTTVVDLASVKDNELFGSKACRLASMLQAGFPVPPGFCISSRAYKDHILSAGVQEKLSGSKESLTRETLARIRQDIISAPVSESTLEELREHFDSLAPPVMAVRSSAVCEDLQGHSFAGLYETFTGITTWEDCIDAVKKCWASFWSDRAFAYRSQKAFTHTGDDMAVIIQTFIEAGISGVIFTTDPTDCAAGKLIIEACPGAGENLVSGRVVPERVAVKREDLTVVTHSIPSCQAGRVFLDDDLAGRLAGLALKIESLSGGPQDIEWSMKDRDIFLLQCRPITAMKERKPPSSGQVWSNANVGEVLPDVACHMTWSVTRKFIKLLLNLFFGKLGIDMGDRSILGLVAGRIYININIFAAIYRKIPGARNLDMSKFLGGHRGKSSENTFTMPAEYIPDLNINGLAVILRTPAFFFWILSNPPEKGKRFVDSLKITAADLCAVDFGMMSDGELASHADKQLAHLMKFRDVLACVASGMMYFQMLEKLCRKWLRDNNGEIFGGLLVSLGSIESAEPGKKLWEIARFISSHPELEKCVLSGETFEELQGKCAQDEKGRELLRMWEHFMEQHGHHARGEIDVFNPRWSENPDYVLGQVRNYLRSYRDHDPAAHYREQALEREKLTERCLGRLWDPLRRRMFSYVLRQAQEGLSMRECVKSEAIKHISVVRSSLQELGKRLEARGILPCSEDIFFLELEELQAVAKESQSFNVREVIAERRAEYRKNLTLKPPSVIIGPFDPDSCATEEPAEHRDVLKGLPVCPGVARGKARVILRETEHEMVLPGEILVIPFADPGWTPYFVPSAGIVMDLGGMLSHGCIIAREYGIPTISNVESATRVIRTGDIIEVNGTRGTVRIVEKGNLAES